MIFGVIVTCSTKLPPRPLFRIV